MVEPPVISGLAHVDAEVAKGSPYETVIAALDAAARMEGAEEAAYGIAQRRFTISWVYKRPVAELEASLQERLAVDDDPVSRARAAGAAYATYRELKAYFDDAVAELEAAPQTEVVQRALESAARVRARLEATPAESTSNTGPSLNDGDDSAGRVDESGR